MSLIRAALHRIRFRCHQIKIDYYHKRYNNDESPKVVSERVPHVPFWSLRTPAAKINIDDEFTTNGDDLEASQDLYADISCVAVFEQLFTTEIHEDDNVTLVDEQESHGIYDYNCDGKAENQMVADVSSVTPDADRFSATEVVNSKKNATISTKNCAELNSEDSDLNIVTIVSNLEAALAGVEVLDPDSSYLGNLKYGILKPVTSTHPRSFKKIFSLKVGKGRKEAVNITSPFAKCNLEILKLFDEGENSSIGNTTDKPFNAKRQKKSVGRHVLEAFKNLPPEPAKRSFIVHNVIRPAHLYSRENLLLPSEEASLKDSPSPVQVSSSMYSNHGQVTPSLLLQPQFHRLVRKTSFIKRSNSTRSIRRVSSSCYSGANATSSAHSEAFALTGHCQGVSCLNKYGSDGAWKLSNNRCSLQSALFSIGNGAAAAYGVTPLSADLTEEASTEGGHQIYDKVYPTADFETPTNDTATSVGIELKLFKLSKHLPVNEDNSVSSALDFEMSNGRSADTTAIGTELKSFKLSKRSTVNGTHIAAERSPIKISPKGPISSERKSVEEAKISSQMLSIDENDKSNIKASPVKLNPNYESVRVLKYKVLHIQKLLLYIDPCSSEYQQKMFELVCITDQLVERGLRLSKMSLAKEDKISHRSSAAGDVDHTASKSQPLTSMNPNEESHEKDQCESSKSFPPLISNAVDSIKTSFGSLNIFGF